MSFKSIIYTLLILLTFSCQRDTKKKEYKFALEQGTKYFETGKYKKSIEYFLKAVEIDSSNIEGIYKTGVAQATLCLNEPEYCDRAIDNLRKVSIDSPDYQRVNYNLGVCYFQKSRFKKALYYFDKSVQKDSTDVDFLINRAFTKLELQDIDGACNDFERAKAIGDIEADTFIKDFCM